MERAHKLNRLAAARVSSRPQKKAVNLSINGELLNRARSNGLNLSGILEAALEQKLRQHARERWLAENRAGMQAYNVEVEKHGLFSDALRTF